MNKKQVIIVVLIILAILFSGVALVISLGGFGVSDSAYANNSKAPTGGVILSIEQNPNIATNQ